MGTEVWCRNPFNYIAQVVESGCHRVAWDRGTLVKKKIDPIKHADLYFGQAVDWRVLAIGIQGAAEYRPGDAADKPSAVYPVWEYGEDMRLLEELIHSPVGEDEDACGDMSAPGDERPVLGQQHMVIITNLPDAKTGPGRSFTVKLKELVEDYPEVKLYLHGSYSYRVMFGSGAYAVDIDPRTPAQKGRVMLPPGRLVTFEQAGQWPNWVTMCGFKPVELQIPANRCVYNIKSALWAAEHWTSVANFRLSPTASPAPVDHTTPDSQYKQNETASQFTTSDSKGKLGDKQVCDSCTLANSCKHYREGSVCTLPHATPKKLADMFGTRDADLIIDGLTELQKITVRRLERGMALEATVGDVDPEVTKLVGQAFKHGTELAKLNDPNLRGGAKVQVNVGQAGQVGIAQAINPKELVAGAFKELEARGIPRDKITDEMIQGLLAGQLDPQMIPAEPVREIEGRVVTTAEVED